ncbi:MAG: CoA transferase [Dehalococcoidia bacterium]|nr:CoA transferase [Dehalococcoidia bacterium]
MRCGRGAWRSLGRFAATLPAEEVYHGGQRRGATWGAVRSPDENLHDPHFAQDRGFFVAVEQDGIGAVVYPGAPFRFSETPWGIRRPPPRLGEHSAEVLKEWLGMSEREIARLEKTGAVWSDAGGPAKGSRRRRRRDRSEDSQPPPLPA